jgi:hypothetical protein
MAPRPTNQEQLGEIMEAIVSLTRDTAKNQAIQDARHEQYSEEFKKIEARQNYTNGNVKDLLLWQSNMKAVDDYKKTQEAPSSSNPKAPFNWSAYIPYAITLAIALIAIGQYLANQGK